MLSPLTRDHMVCEPTPPPPQLPILPQVERRATTFHTQLSRSKCFKPWNPFRSNNGTRLPVLTHRHTLDPHPTPATPCATAHLKRAYCNAPGDQETGRCRSGEGVPPFPLGHHITVHTSVFACFPCSISLPRTLSINCREIQARVQIR